MTITEAPITTSEPISPRSLARWDLVARLRAHLFRTSNPRNQTLTLVSATALLGLLTSIALLHLHLHNMALRYIISVAIAYAGFLGMVRLWILYRQRTWRRAGATGTRPITARAPTQPKQKDPDGGFSWLDLLDSLGIFDDFIVVALLIAGVISIFFAIWHVINFVVLGPEFLAEVLLDGVFSAALYRRLGQIEHQHWMKTVFAKTKAPLLWTLLFFAFLGAVSAHYAPEAVSIGGVVRHLLAN
jgi:cytochrome c biogenesis protein CcdA